MSDSTTATETPTAGSAATSANFNGLTHEQLAIVMLLCTPSQLQIDWKKDLPNDMEKDLKAVGLTVQAQTRAVTAIRAIEDRGEKNVFLAVAAAVKDVIYGSGEPHPPIGVAQAVVAELRKLDGN